MICRCRQIPDSILRVYFSFFFFFGAYKCSLHFGMVECRLCCRRLFL